MCAAGMSARKYFLAEQNTPPRVSAGRCIAPQNFILENLMPKERNSPIINYFGGKRRWLDFFYHQMLDIPLVWFILAAMMVFFGVNSIFAFLYYFLSGVTNTISPDGKAQFVDVLFFSCTFPVIGFGGIAPIGLGRAIAMLHVFLGLLFLSSLTGLIFARLSRGKSPLVWSKPVVLHEESGDYYIQVRVTNVIGNDVVHVTASLYLQRSEKNVHGETIRKLIPVPLEVSNIPLTALSWIISHRVGADSPLMDWVNGKFHEHECIVGFIYGFDSTLGKEVHSYCKWSPLELERGTFSNVITSYKEDAELRLKVAIDLDKLDEVIPRMQ
jgi:inward rectifier potassium channel